MGESGFRAYEGGSDSSDGMNDFEIPLVIDEVGVVGE